MRLSSRLVALERRHARLTYTDAELRARLDPVAREHDVSLDELVAETRRVLAMTDAEREAYGREVRQQAEAAGLL